MTVKTLLRAGLMGLAIALPAVPAAIAPGIAQAETLRIQGGTIQRALQVPMNKAIVVESDTPFAELSIANPGIADVAALTNGPRDFLLLAWYGYAMAAFDTTTMIERMLWNPDGGCVAGVGHSRATFPVNAEATTEFFLANALGEAARLGDEDVLASQGGLMERLKRAFSGDA